MSQPSTQRFPFSNQGMVQKIDLSQLSDGQYQYLLNIVSEQEGNLSPRNGYQDVAGSLSGTVNLIHSMLVARLNPAANPNVYFGEGTNIHRGTVTAGTVSDSVIASGVANANNRFGMTQFKTDQYNNQGTVYIGTGYNALGTGTPGTAVRGMFNDAYISQNGSYTTNNIGILPPFFPVFAAPGSPTLVNVEDVGTSVVRYPSTGSVTVASVVQTTVQSDTYTITPSNNGGSSPYLTELQSGMLVKIGSQWGVVGDINVGLGVFYTELPTIPTVGDTIIAYATTNQTSTDGSDTSYYSPTGHVDLSLSGTAATGYSSDDLIHFSVLLNPTGIATGPNVGTITFRLYPETTFGGSYEYVYTVATTAPANPSANPTWLEIDVPKSSFTANGVGSGSNSWVDIDQLEVAVSALDNTMPFSFAVGQTYGVGGGGPNSAGSAALFPYTYIYTYFNPVTGAESNPCPITIPTNGVSVTQQRIKVNIYGCYNTGFSSGVTKIRIYRQGGTFTDGLYRYIGQIDNPGLNGDGSSKVANPFYDNIDDLSIVNANTAFFDNDAPVTSDLNQEYTGTITPSSGSLYHYTSCNVSVSGVTDLRNILTPGTEITVGVAGSPIQETVIVNTVSTGSFDTYFQYNHSSSETITWSTNAGIACDVLLSAMDCLWVAGNPQNPNTLYRSKTAQPESFPIINQSTGNAHSLIVSSADNPINGLAEYNSQIVCLCQNGIYTIRLDNGVMRGPFKTPSNRGLLYKGAWGYVDNEIWFLAHDGIYSWSGGVATKVSLPLDFIFNNKTVNGVAPYDLYGASVSPFYAHLCNIQQKNNEVFFNYLDTSGHFYVLRFNKVFNRWSIDQVYDANSTQTVTQNGFTVKTTSLTCMCIDRSTGDLFAAKATTNSGVTTAGLIYYNQANFYQDGGTSAPGSVPIYYDAIGKSFDMGAPFTKKQFTDVAIELTSNQVTAYDVFKLQLYYDYSATPDSIDVFTLTPSSTGRQMIPFSLQNTGGTPTSLGKEARAVQFEIFGTSTAFNFLHGLAFTFNPLSDLIQGRITDWDDLGYPHDKRLDVITIEYDNGNSQVQLYLDIINGVKGNTTILGVQQLTLPATTGRAKVSIPIVTDTIAKMVRLRPVVPGQPYEIFNYSFPEFFKYPPDVVYFTDFSNYGYEYEKRFYQLYINCDTNGFAVPVNIIGDGNVLQTVTVSGTSANRMQPIPINPDTIANLVRLVASTSFLGSNPTAKFQLFEHKFDFEQLPKPTVLSTPWNDFGYDYLKWAEQIAFDVNTNGKDVPVQVWCDGSLAQTVTVNGTQADRNVNITLNPGITFFQMRLVVDPTAIPSGGRFQLWEYKPITQPADKGPVSHSYDWDSLGHPYDKKISEVTIEFETQGQTVEVAIDTLTGIDGNTQNLDAITLNLVSSNRGFKTFPLPETICKMVRIRNLGTNGAGTDNPALKMWSYKFGGVINYPPDIVEFTDWSDLGSPCDKIFRGVGVQIDTGGVNCTVYLDVDGVQQQSWIINTTSAARQTFLSPANNVEINGKMYRLRFVPGTGGKAQLFGNPTWDCPKDACPFVFWDTYNQAFGSAGFTVIKQVFFDYKCDVPVTLSFYNQQGQLFWTQTVPAHATRAAERFYLPSVNNGVLNKSKKHRMTVQTTDPNHPFKFYKDSSRTLYLNLSANQQEGYFKEVTWSDLPLQV